MRVYPSLPLLNFLGLLLLAVQRGSSDLYKQLAKHYAPYVKEVGIWDDALAQLGEMYFAIRIPRPGNPLMVCTFLDPNLPVQRVFASWGTCPEARDSQHPFELSRCSASHTEGRMLILTPEKGYNGFNDGVWRESETKTEEGGCSSAASCGLICRAFGGLLLQRFCI